MRKRPWGWAHLLLRAQLQLAVLDVQRLQRRLGLLQLLGCVGRRPLLRRHRALQRPFPLDRLEARLAFRLLQPSQPAHELRILRRRVCRLRPELLELCGQLIRPTGRAHPCPLRLLKLRLHRGGGAAVRRPLLLEARGLVPLAAECRLLGARFLLQPPAQRFVGARGFLQPPRKLLLTTADIRRGCVELRCHRGLALPRGGELGLRSRDA